MLLEEIADRAAMAIDSSRLHVRLEAELATRKEREKELEGFAHAVSHNLKGPISTTRTGVEILKESLRDPDFGFSQGDIQTLLDKMANTMGSSYALIEEFLALAEWGQAPDRVREVDVGEVVRRSLRVLESTIEQKGVEVRVDEDLGSVLAHPSHVYQVFSNLIGNAVLHNDATDQVVEVRNLGSANGAHRYLIRDNGSGMPESCLGKHFKPFFQAKGGGKVMELAIVDKVLRVYGGEIMAYNNDGANFDFVIRDYEKGEGS